MGKTNIHLLCLVTILILLFESNTLMGQFIVPSNRLGNWTSVGYSSAQRTIPRHFDNNFDMKTMFGANGNGVADNTQPLSDALTHCRNSNLSSAVLIFPPGTYRFNSQILLNGLTNIRRTDGSTIRIVLHGYGSNLTTFKFDSYNIAGSMIQINSANGVGIENLSLIRDNNYVHNPAGMDQHYIAFSSSTSCWVYGVEAVKAVTHHVNISGGNNIVIKGCYFHEADDYGVGGRGYGVNISYDANNCLVEDNIFRYLRHSIAFQFGAYNNVAGYNFIRDGHATDGDGDYIETGITCHGSGNGGNLIEGNIVDLLGADNVNGLGGNDNTFFRNRVDKYFRLGNHRTTNKFESNYVNIIGNHLEENYAHFTPEYGDGVLCHATALEIYAEIRERSPVNHATYINWVEGLFGGPPSASEEEFFLPDISYYYPNDVNSRPSFLNVSGVSWPPIGPHLVGQTNVPLLSQSNAAEKRWLGSSILTVAADPLIYNITLSPAQLEGGGSVNRSYKIDGINVLYTSYNGQGYTTVEAVSSYNDFKKWSDESTENPRTLVADLNSYAIFESPVASGILQQNTRWNIAKTLTGDVYVPWPITLTIASNVTIDFGTHIIVSTGGTIVDQSGTVICAYLTQSNVLIGLFPTIQSAVNYSSSGQTVELQARTHNESFSLNSKSGITISGAGINNTTINGPVTFNSSQNCTMTDLTVANNISLNYGNNYNYLNNLKILGNIQPNMGSYSNMTNVDLTAPNSVGIMPGYSHVEVHYSPIQNRSVAGIYATWVNMSVFNSMLCTNGPLFNRLDVVSNNSPDINLHCCWFSNPDPGSTVSGSYIHWDWWSGCGLYKEAAASDNALSYKIKELPSALEGLSEEKKNAGKDDYKKVMESHRALFDKIRGENNGKLIEFKQYEKELTGIISQFKDIMKKYPGSVSSVQSLQEVISYCRLLQDKQSAKQVLSNLLADKKYEKVYSHIKLLSIPLYIDDQNYDGALSLCDTVMDEIPNTIEAACLLYNKGKILETLKNDSTNAEKIYNKLIEQYPNSMYAFLINESLGKETNPQKSEDVQKIDKYELNNYPNPFNPSTVISYQLPEPGRVSLMVFDLLGREVATLADEMKGMGSYSATFDGSKLSSGLYFVRLTVQPADGSTPFTKTMKMLMTK